MNHAQNKFDVKLNVIPNELEKYIAFTINNNLELVKQKGVNPYEYVNSFKKFPEDKLPDRSKFFISVKSKCISGKNTYMLSMFGTYNGWLIWSLF